MPIIDKTVLAPELIGTPGYPIHYAAYGLPAPTKVIQVLVDDDGNEIVEGPSDGGSPPPPVLTRRQLRLGLLASGITTAQVEAVIAATPNEIARETAQIEWAGASTYERSHPLVDQIGDALGLTPEQIDEMWIAAVAL
ncbi:hypothetical protein ACERNI_17810 [Camelimonas sp. ID_303_24]